MALPLRLPFVCVMPSLSRRPTCSVTPTPTTISPEATRGSQRSFCSLEPAAAMAVGAMIDEATYGTGVVVAPRASAMSAASRWPKPTPP